MFNSIRRALSYLFSIEKIASTKENLERPQIEKDLNSQVGIPVIVLGSGSQIEMKPNARNLRNFAQNCGSGRHLNINVKRSDAPILN